MIGLILVTFLSGASTNGDWVRLQELCEARAITRSRLLRETIRILQKMQSEKTVTELQMKLVKRYIATHTCEPDVVDE